MKRIWKRPDDGETNPFAPASIEASEAICTTRRCAVTFQIRMVIDGKRLGLGKRTGVREEQN